MRVEIKLLMASLWLIANMILLALFQYTQNPLYLKIAWTLILAMAIYDLIAVIKIFYLDKGPRPGSNPGGRGHERGEG